MGSSNKKNLIVGNARFEDGKIIKPTNDEIKKNSLIDVNNRNLDYLYILKALQIIPFGVGRKLLIDFLRLPGG